MVIAATIQRWRRWKKCNHTAWPTPEVPQRCAGLGCQCEAIFGLRSLGPLWRKGSLRLDRAWKRHSAISMRNILAFEAGDRSDENSRFRKSRGTDSTRSSLLIAALLHLSAFSFS